MRDRKSRAEHLFAELAAAFINEVSNRTSLITVTRAALSESGTYATILFTVLPEEKEAAVAEFLNRSSGEFKAYVTERAKMKLVPAFRFTVDEGDKHRRRLDSIGPL